jgi:hypothetical protein
VICSGPFRAARRQRRAEHGAQLLGHHDVRQPTLGQLGGQLHVLVAQRGHPDRDVRAVRMVDHLQRLAQAGAAVGGQRDRVQPVMFDPLPAPHRAADLDGLPGARHRLVVGHAVEALDHLRAGRAEPEQEPAVGQRVQPGGRHRGQRRGAAVDRQDPGADLHPLGARGEVAQQRHRVEAVGLGDPHRVEPGPLHRHHRLGVADRVGAVLELGGQQHSGTQHRA